jgi:hypothetical protein
MKVKDFLKIENLYNGRMISESKSGYRDRNPNSVVYYNANIITINDGKIWYGDLDLTKDGETLKRISNSSGETLFILRESDCMFENEDQPIQELIKKAVWSTTQEIPFK